MKIYKNASLKKFNTFNVDEKADFIYEVDKVTDISKILSNKKTDLVVLAGYLKKIPAEFIQFYPEKIINIHPSLLPKYKGLNTHQRAIDNNEKFVAHNFSGKYLDCGSMHGYIKSTFEIAKL